MGKKLKKARFLLSLAFLSLGIFPQGVFSQEGSVQRGQTTIPDILRRPERSESPRYPRDVVIGELGQGESPSEAYQFARELLSALVAGNQDAQILSDSSSVITESLGEEIMSLEPRSYRIGGGRNEPDGSVSFLVRFLGVEESITGELFLRKTESPEVNDAAEARWFLDDLVLEEKRDLTEIKDSYRYDFSPYERFY